MTDSEVIDVEPNGIVVTIRFTPVEADLVLKRAEFDQLGVSAYCRQAALDKAMQSSWSRTVTQTMGWSST